MSSCPVCKSGGPKTVLPFRPKSGQNVIETFTKPIKREDFKQTTKVSEYQVNHAKTLSNVICEEDEEEEEISKLIILHSTLILKSYY